MVKEDALSRGGIAQTLLIEDEVRKIVEGKALNARKLQDAKRRGYVPRGEHSCFGDFPPHLLQAGPAAAAARRLLSAGGPDERGAQLRQSWGDLSQSRYLISSGARRPRRTPQESPPRAGATVKRKIEATHFRDFYNRGQLPIHVHHAGVGNRAAWSVELDTLNFTYYLPMFFEGIREKQDPYRFLAIQGATDMIESGLAAKILAVIPQLVVPLKAALNTRDREVMCVVLKMMKTLVTSVEGAADALVPYFRQLLPVLNIFRNSNDNIGDAIDYGQRKCLNLGDLIQDTLETIELHASPDAQAFINIKYMIPTYESALYTPARGEGSH